MAGLNLSALEGFGDLSMTDLVDGGLKEGPRPGQYMVLALEDIEEDPNQPRVVFDEARMEEMRVTIRTAVAEGKPPIKKPISVIPHPSKPGKWLIEDGARRYRNSLAEGLKTIPARWEEQKLDYLDKAMMNDQAESHTPMEWAEIIRVGLEMGLKKGYIAKRIGKSPAWVTKHASLLELPPCLNDLYTSKRCEDAESLYLLGRAYEEHSAEIDALCAENRTITQAEVVALINSWKMPVPPPPPPVVDVVEPTGGLDRVPQTMEAPAAPEPMAPVSETDTSLPATPPGYGNSAPKPSAKKIRNPIVQVEHEGRLAALLIDRLASPGLVWVRYYEDQVEREIEIQNAHLKALVEGD